MDETYPQCPGSGPADRSTAADILLREEPDEEEDDQEEQDGDEEDDEGMKAIGSEPALALQLLITPINPNLIRHLLPAPIETPRF